MAALCYFDVVGQYLEGDEPKFADCRNLLRSGPASSLRINIRAVSDPYNIFSLHLLLKVHCPALFLLVD